MIRSSIPLRLAATMLAIALLVACAPGEPVPSAEEIQAAVNTSVAETMEAQGQIATSVALTVAAREAEAAAALPTATLSPTMTPLPTLTPVLATATPFDVASSSGSSGGGGGGGSSSGAGAYACGVVSKRPRDNTEFRRTNTFDVKFTIVNTGTATWQAGKDVMLLGNPGPTLSIPTGFVVQLPKMEPGDTFAVGPFDATAPDQAGHYVVDFKVEGGFCYPYVAFNVVR